MHFKHKLLWDSGKKRVHQITVTNSSYYLERSRNRTSRVYKFIILLPTSPCIREKCIHQRWTTIVVVVSHQVLPIFCKDCVYYKTTSTLCTAILQTFFVRGAASAQDSGYVLAAIVKICTIVTGRRWSSNDGPKELTCVAKGLAKKMKPRTLKGQRRNTCYYMFHEFTVCSRPKTLGQSPSVPSVLYSMENKTFVFFLNGKYKQQYIGAEVTKDKSRGRQQGQYKPFDPKFGMSVRRVRRKRCGEGK